jgi:hypothetical protein
MLALVEAVIDPFIAAFSRQASLVADNLALRRLLRDRDRGREQLGGLVFQPALYT